MNRTTAFLALAAALLLVAVVLGLPKGATAPPPPRPPEPLVVKPPKPPEPASHPGSLTLAGKLSHPYVVPGTTDVFATLDVTAVEVPGSRRAPVNLAVVIDRSGSMAGPKLAGAKNAALNLVELLDENDRLAVVHYGSDVRCFPGARATPENKRRLKAYLRGIEDEGGTNIGDGLMAGKAQLDAARGEFKVNRLLLLSDGQPTVGITTAQGLVRVASRLREGGVTLTSLGVGADFNEDLMQRLADVGGGSYGFISQNNSQAMATLFEKDLKQAGTTVASQVVLKLALPPGVTFREVYGRPALQSGSTVSVALNDFAAGQVERLVVRLTATTQAAVNTPLEVGAFSLDYHDVLADRAADSALALSATVTADTKVALARRDKDAFVAAVRAQSSANYRTAADELEKGNVGKAKAALQQNEVLFDDAAAVGGAGAVQQDRDQNKQFYGLATSAPAQPAAQQAETRKAMKVQGLRSSGRGDSLY